jgi:hypothetical protein
MYAIPSLLDCRWRDVPVHDRHVHSGFFKDVSVLEDAGDATAALSAGPAVDAETVAGILLALECVHKVLLDLRREMLWFGNVFLESPLAILNGISFITLTGTFNIMSSILVLISFDFSFLVFSSVSGSAIQGLF